MRNELAIRLLIVDDDDAFRDALTDELSERGFDVESVPDAPSALRAVDRETFDVAIFDLNMPGMSGDELLSEVRKHSPTTEVIILTGHGTVSNAVRTMKEGAYDFLTKPCNLDELEALVRKAHEKQALVRKNRLLERELARHDRFPEFTGNSPALQSVLQLIAKVSHTDSTVLIQGESGVGKELAANAIVQRGARQDRPFIVVDCTSLQETLLQSELFGHERGAFTGAVARKHGLFEVADGGTLFLDEIGEISVPLQAQILRVVDTRSFRRVGGVKDIHVDVRLICATNRDLAQMVTEGKFRRDLYYRINVVSLTLPPLRERREDIPLLVKFFAEKFQPATKELPSRFPPEIMTVLQAHSWPGNIRELQNVVERAVVLSEGEEITIHDLPTSVRKGSEVTIDIAVSERPTLEELETTYISRLLEECRGHRGHVAEILGISERNLYRKLKKLPSSVSGHDA
jgi:DNA-binding NtrC family response regulator